MRKTIDEIGKVWHMEYEEIQDILSSERTEGCKLALMTAYAYTIHVRIMEQDKLIFELQEKQQAGE